MSLSTITPIKRGEEYLQRIADAIESSASELPAYGSGDAGKVLTVASGGSSVEWDEVEALPSYAAGDSGKVLGLTGSPLAPAWVQPEGGDVVVFKAEIGNSVGTNVFELASAPTPAQVAAAINAGKTAIIVFGYVYEDTWYPSGSAPHLFFEDADFQETISESTIKFSRVAPEGGFAGIVLHKMVYDFDGESEYKWLYAYESYSFPANT